MAADRWAAGDHAVIAPPYIATASDIDTIVERWAMRSMRRSEQAH